MKSRGAVRRMILLLVLLIAVLVILNETVFRIHSVRIEGNYRIPSGDIVTLAGLDTGASYFFINEERIAEGINSNRYLVYRKLEKTFPDRLTLFVTEKTPCCVLKSTNGLYLMDQEGMVLEKIGQPDAEGWITVTGLTVREIRVGSVVNSSNPEQLKACTLILDEMLVQGVTGLFSEMNCSDPGRLFLTSRDGYIISLGDAKDIRAKILTIRGVLEYMQIYDMPPGSLDASVPGNITYTPE
ncbi:MAG: FtsQ-type POTRA domain-containing protein [Clostridia bacterium]|nr:FtsQ-type POTRA domain-containing protein [Clostridia bacterium]